MTIKRLIVVAVVVLCLVTCGKPEDAPQQASEQSTPTVESQTLAGAQGGTVAEAKAREVVKTPAFIAYVKEVELLWSDFNRRFDPAKATYGAAWYERWLQRARRLLDDFGLHQQFEILFYFGVDDLMEWANQRAFGGTHPTTDNTERLAREAFAEVGK